MAVVPIHLSRISQNLRAFNVLHTVRDSQARLFQTQNQLATGLRFAMPSEDPVRAAAAGRLDRRLDVLNQVQANLRTANAAINQADAAMSSAIELVRDAYAVAAQAASDSTSEEERRALVPIIDSTLRQLISVGNRTWLGTYLFSGHPGQLPPFERTTAGVLFRGDGGRLLTIADSDLSQETFTISGLELFGAASQRVRGAVDLDPLLTPQTRVQDVRGANGSGVQLGTIVVDDGSQSIPIDLSAAATMGDVIDLMNAALPSGFQASLTTNGILLSSGTPGAALSVTDPPGGRTAADLGILSTTRVAVITGRDLDPKLTPRTALSDLLQGAGIDLSGGIGVRVGNDRVTVDFAGAQTLEDVLNAINQTGLGVWARISEDGRTLEVLNRVSGAPMALEENGGLAATNLGIRSLYGGTRLSELNEGRGVTTVEGLDFRITARDGTAIDIDLDALDLTTATVQDAIDLINSTGGGAVTASLTPSGNGILLTDNTSGPGELTIARLNHSPAIDGLGLAVSGSGGTLTGQDVNRVTVNSPFTALIELLSALERNDQSGITAAGERLNQTMQTMLTRHGELAAQARALDERSQRIDAELTGGRILLSDVRDADLAEAVVRFQQVQTALQANLAVSSRVMNLSLLDYLG